METNSKLLKISFEDVYGTGLNPTNYIKNEYTGTQLAPNANNVYVYDCFFHDFSSSSNGGAIYCSSSVYKLLIEQSSFFSCKTSAYGGGGVYFDCSGNYECVMSKICAFGCSCNNHGQFAFISIHNSANHKNHFNDSTITHSLKDGKTQYDSIFLRSDTILFPSNNLTNNECYRSSAFCCVSRRSTTSETCWITYCSVVNNTANGGYYCIRLYSSSSTHRIDACNIINNKQTTTTEGTIYVVTDILFKDSCILGNDEGKTFFYFSNSYKITISNCTIDNTRYSGGGSIIFTQTIKHSFIHALSHIVTRICDSNFDSYGTLSAKPIVPPQSTKNPCIGYFMSCNIKKPTIDPFRCIEFIFLLTVLPSDPSNDYKFYSHQIFGSGFC
jgi:predicted outer membrane repeat protein